MKPLSLVLATVVFLSCSAYKAQHAGIDTNRARSETAARAIPVDTTKFESEPLATKQALLISEIDKYQAELKANGQYDCCVKPACKQCALTAGECHCRQVIDKNGPCCGECTQAWVEGRGVAAGIDREKVLEHLGCVRELYEKKVPEGVTPPGQAKSETEQHEHEHH